MHALRTTVLARSAPVARLGAAAAVAAILLAPGTAHAQLGKKKDKSQPTTQPTNRPGQPATPTASQPAGAPKSILDDVLKKGRVHDWTLRVSLHLDSYQDTPVQTLPGAAPRTIPQTPGIGTPGQGPTIVPFNFKTAAIVFPITRSTGTSELGEPSAKILFDQRDATSQMTPIDNLPAGARYGRWDMTDKQGRAIDADFELPTSCWETIYDEAKAAKAIWPASGKWSKVGASALADETVGFAPHIVLAIGPSSPKVHEALTAWCGNKPPQSIPPAQLAKFLAAKVLDTIQPSGDGLVSSQTGLLQGFDLHPVEQTLAEGRGSEHDIANLLCSVYRAAGLPARVVIGYDLTETKGQDVGLKRKRGGSIRSWVEFLLYDETVTMPGPGGEGKEVWVPVDIVRQRKSSSRAPSINSPWKYFGNNDETDDVVPIAFHYHPPLAGAVSHGSPCFWGWMTTPEVQQGVSQQIRFTATSSVRKGEPSGGGGTR